MIARGRWPRAHLACWKYFAWREARQVGWLFPCKPKIIALSPYQLNRALTSDKHRARFAKPATLHSP
jgi:hypothetical protein